MTRKPKHDPNWQLARIFIVFLAFLLLLIGIILITEHKSPISMVKAQEEAPKGEFAVLRGNSTLSLAPHMAFIGSNSLLQAFNDPKPPIGYKPLEIWLDKLKDYENCPDHGIIDSNGLRSYGAYCYQEATYLMFMKKYKLMPYAEEKELLNNLSDYDTQRELTRLIVINEREGYRNWFTSVKIRDGLGLPPL